MRGINTKGRYSLSTKTLPRSKLLLGGEILKKAEGQLSALLDMIGVDSANLFNFMQGESY